MNKMVSVQYESKHEPGTFGGREYTYYAGIELNVGDLIIAPTRDAYSKARVSQIDVPDGKVDERFVPFMKTINKKWTEESEETINEQYTSNATPEI